MKPTAPAILAHRLAFGTGEPSPEMVEWLRRGLQRHLRGEAPLAVALELSSSACGSARNRALRRAADLIADGRGELPPLTLAKRLSAEMRRFERVMLRHVRDGLQPENPLDAALADAYIADASPPTSPRQLLRLLR